MKIKKRLIVPLQRRGGIGKSLTVGVIAQFLDSAQATWRGFDLDADHKTSSRMFPAKVTLVPLGAEPENEILRVLKHANNEKISIIDPQAHTGDKIISMLKQIKFVSRYAEEGGRLTILLFVSDDLEVIVNIQEIVEVFGDTVDYLVIRNRVKNGERVGRLFDGSELSQSLGKFGAKTIEIPMLLTLALNHLSQAELRHDRGISHLEYIQNPDLRADPDIKFIIEEWIHTVFKRLHAVSELIIPGGLPAPAGPAPQGPANSFKRGARLNVEGGL